MSSDVLFHPMHVFDVKLYLDLVNVKWLILKLYKKKYQKIAYEIVYVNDAVSLHSVMT